jgi:hypothetical protein
MNTTEILEEPANNKDNILIGMTIKEAEDFFKKGKYTCRGKYVTEVSDSGEKDIRDSRLNVDTENGKIINVKYVM